MQAVIIICAYSGYKITDDISLYALEVLHYNEVDAAAFGTSALWLRPVFAVLAGFLADQHSAPNDRCGLPGPETYIQERRSPNLSTPRLSRACRLIPSDARTRQMS